MGGMVRGWDVYCKTGGLGGWVGRTDVVVLTRGGGGWTFDEPPIPEVSKDLCFICRGR